MQKNQTKDNIQTIFTITNHQGKEIDVTIVHRDDEFKEIKSITTDGLTTTLDERADLCLKGTNIVDYRGNIVFTIENDIDIAKLHKQIAQYILTIHQNDAKMDINVKIIYRNDESEAIKSITTDGLSIPPEQQH